MSDKDWLALYDEQERRNAVWAGIERISTAHTVRHVDRTGGRSFVLYSDLRGLNDAQIEAIIAAEVAFFSTRELEFEWKVYEHDAPQDLRERLIARGFSDEDWETLLIRELADAPGRLFDLRGHTIERVSDPAEVDDVMVVVTGIWGPDEHGTGDRLRREFVESPVATSIFLARVAGAPVGAAWVNYTPESDFASLFGGGVLQPFRGQGVYGALLAARAREARERGRRYLMIDAGPMSLPIVESLEFIRISSSCPCVLSP
ncbi:MAG: GNAT family N-acetyltransferase [Anaerolineae bacterium]|nr:GNAT family N-acetyltransferase [Anaerolineae bacterium]